LNNLIIPEISKLATPERDTGTANAADRIDPSAATMASTLDRKTPSDSDEAP
jgi:hypothetical protein